MSGGPLLVAIDAGSGSGRCVIFDESGNIVSSAKRQWSPFSPPGLEPLGSEFNAETIWQTLADLIRQAVGDLDPDRIAAVSTTAQRVGCAFLDKHGHTLYLGPNRDVRAIASELAFESLVDPDEIYRISNRWPPWIFAPARLCWFKSQAPEVFERITDVLSFSDWVNFMLCGEKRSEITSSVDLMLLDVATRQWSETLASAIDIDVNMLPELVLPGQQIGSITKTTAAATGLPAGTPVIAGAGDSQCALLASYVLDPGSVGVIAGSSAPVMLVTDQALVDPEQKLWTGCHVADDRWLLEANTGEMGTILDWLADLLAADLKEAAFKDGRDPYRKINELARQALPCSMGVTSHLGPRLFNLRNINTGRPAALLMPFGETTQTRPDRSAIFRSFFENCAYGIKTNLEALEKVYGTKASSITVSGGLSRSDIFAEILSAVLNRRVAFSSALEASALGAAVCAATGVGLASSLADCAQKIGTDRRIFEPNEDDTEQYTEGYELWLDLEQQLEDF